MSDSIDLAELRRLHEAATKGEWHVLRTMETSSNDVTQVRVCTINPTEWIAKVRACFVGNGGNSWDTSDADFIAAAHNALPALLDELEAARLEMRRLGSVIAELREVARLKTALRAAAVVLSGQETSKSMLIHALELCQQAVKEDKENDRQT